MNESMVRGLCYPIILSNQDLVLVRVEYFPLKKKKRIPSPFYLAFALDNLDVYSEMNISNYHNIQLEQVF